jgi:hypothetical protein
MPVTFESGAGLHVPKQHLFRRHLRELPYAGRRPRSVRAAYGASLCDRLARIKAQCDLDNLFRANENIRPAGG